MVSARGWGGDQRAGSRAGAGVAHLPGRPVAAGLSDAGAPARPATTPLAADVLTAEATANGFTAYWVGDQIRLAHHCHGVTGIDRATTALVAGMSKRIAAVRRGRLGISVARRHRCRVAIRQGRRPCAAGGRPA